MKRITNHLSGYGAKEFAFPLPSFKSGLHEPQLQVEWSVTFFYSLVVAADLERAAASLDYNRRN